MGREEKKPPAPAGAFGTRVLRAAGGRPILRGGSSKGFPLKLTLAYCPCPNDTFIFHDLATRHLTLPGRQIDVHLADVETLNRAAMDVRYDVTKLSLHACLRVQDRYRMLAVGAAMGFGCGPVVVSKRPLTAEDLAGCCVAIPGELTTAALLLKLWAPEIRQTLVVRYDEVLEAVGSGTADAGVIIHESRFLYEAAGLLLVTDLGAWWEQTTSLPVPLGCIAARKDLGDETIRAFESLLRRGIEHSLADPEATRPYVSQHAVEMDPTILRKHIETFVNDYTLEIGNAGRQAIARMGAMAADAGIVP